MVSEVCKLKLQNVYADSSIFTVMELLQALLYTSMFLHCNHCSIALCSSLVPVWGHVPNRISKWQLKVVGLWLGCRVCYQTQCHMGMVHLVQAAKQGRLHPVGPAVPSIGMAAGPGWLEAVYQTRPLILLRLTTICY
jgi:hypothetical protein